ncbi:methyltransferase domain-containing protein [Flavobacterium gawalongense]|uniref:Methyltransferase domain-containing protein n=1 Tax=Flavobacterium gawalongense TaxID=2594432 RepID=A0A553BCQ4_9FLAO|nr:methyltransferase domain-containing protein [Flavobacterium gawalongense]TRW98548.1 methyltransferase domain-containing protein [Flavobacterium gawalongense]TRX03069.1 methyltransferase domain-containing protein [Flavobacterium gawalongense]TRX06033.1 methyltransferase domain-containing protein [Flavobacterium gawalongense]TRX10961.1 methyltransferase domain-containing protein [Flavobacterium gawalongense]TRX22619.1 methyltransferase domain-containing protein [Flavobacterium gawalongense]
MEDVKCCVASCEKSLDAAYWEAQYKAKATGWDLGKVSPPIQTYMDTIENKNISILIPGCGNSYEAEYLLEHGFTNITVIDIAPTPVAVLKDKFKNNPNIQIILGDFFEHQGKYDLIIEQTFFCALPPTMRQKYVWKMHQLLADEGKLAGLLFNRTFEVSPPFGGSKEEYETLFAVAFDFLKMDLCPNSIAPRANSELFFELKKNNKVKVNVYELEGITCNGSVQSVTKKLAGIDGILNVSMSSNFAEVLIISKNEMAIGELQNAISDDEKYKIEKIS